MTLQPGARVGVHEILELIGAGGMGEVYRARDRRLNRDVAIKILPEAFARDHERVARFEREAQTLAGLNHQNIAQVYGIVDAPAGLVMELVEGADLSARIGARGLPLREALPLARQIAAALEAAHERGIVHRDLKPANVKVRDDGAVKVLDFGLAKAMDTNGAASALANSPTFMTAATQLGTILGTAAYMSPEQARGKPVDKRTDIWAFGCVLFEMLTGRRAFEGETITDILGAIVHKTPDFTLLPAGTPPPVRTLIERCLEKDPTRRLRDIGEARFALEASESASTVAMAAPAPAFRAGSLLRRAGVPLAIAAALGAGIAVGSFVWRRASTPAPSMRLSIALPAGLRIASPPILSPDGTMLAFVAADEGSERRVLYLRGIDSFDIRAAAGDVSAEPFFSPDSRHIGFVAGNVLKRMRVSDGSVVDLARMQGFTGAVWSDAGDIIFSNGVGSPLRRVRADGGPVEDLTQLRDNHYAHVWPQWTAEGIVFRAWTGDDEDAGPMCLLRMPAKEWSCVRSPANLRFTGTGYVLTDGVQDELRGMPFTEWPRDAFAAPDHTVLTPVSWMPNSERGLYSFSKTGTLVYVPGSPTRQRMVWLSPRNNSEEVVLDQDAVYGRLSLSPDGKRIAYGGLSEIWVVEIERGTRVRIATAGNNLRPFWTSDGGGVVFSSNRDERWAAYVARERDGWRNELLLKRPLPVYPESMAPDGALLFVEVHPKTGEDVWIQGADGKATPLAAGPAVETAPRFSADGQLVAYLSTANGRAEIFVQPRAGGPPVQVSTEGGTSPMWSRKGRDLYYSQRSTLMRVAIDNAGRAARPEPVMRRPDVSGVTDTSLDGTRLLGVKFLPEGMRGELRLITNFFDELRAKVGEGSGSAPTR